MRTKKSISAAERARDYHAGPHDSEPLDPAGNRLKAAWDLAGRVKGGNPDEIRRKIINFAREHGLMDRLPQSALEWHRSQSGNLSQKAKGDDLRDVLRYAYQQIPDDAPEERRRFIQVVQNRGNTSMLPDEAHGFMHQHNMPHQHEGEENEMHTHTVTKAFNPVAKEFVSVKSYRKENEPLVIEGWLSTPDKDLENDIVQPESFQPAMKSYFRRRAPLSYEHKTDRLPAGHLQRAAIVRNGKIMHEAAHPTDPAPFEHLQESMAETGTHTGVYVRGVITNEQVGKAVGQGDMGSFSYIANVVKYRILPGGGREFLEQDPWLESTVAAYPINRNAVITVAKAYGLTDEETAMDWEAKLEELLAGAAALPAEPETAPAVKSGLTTEDLKAVLGDFRKELAAEIESRVEERVQKALTTQRGESAGRRAPVQSEMPNIEEEPLAYAVHKARSVKSEDDLTDRDKQLIWGITRAAIAQGMRDADIE
jgi:hypothetical protein